MDKITIFLIYYSVSTFFQDLQDVPSYIRNQRFSLLSIAICFTLLFPFPKWIILPEVPTAGRFKVWAEKEATFKGKFTDKLLSDISAPSSSAVYVFKHPPNLTILTDLRAAFYKHCISVQPELHMSVLQDMNIL